MQTRKLGNSDLQITPVGYGAWAVGDSGWQFAWGSEDDNDSIAAIHRATWRQLDRHRRRLRPGTLRGSCRACDQERARRETIYLYIFTKCGLRWEANGQVRKVLSPESIPEKSKIASAVFLSM
jgi:hypothetical protein